MILQQQFNTGTLAGKLALTMFAAFAEFENGTRQARQREGIARARLEGGKYQGRKPNHG
ncbi:recombinase family protein [Paraburkholderia sp. Ac-20336]|uniref:recombinase family protein n=1 Tax=Paraburkholderia sp. Ac-20336 TaxID=2703886 RepID=UPI0019805AAF|nr:recombinase family protein [Paraburkholderia sp. Ac-20336]